MDQQNKGLDNLVNKVFSKDIQQKRAKKEILAFKDLDTLSYKISLQTTSFGLRILVEVTEIAVLAEIPNLQRITFPIVFEILMDQNFPFNPPKVVPKSHFYQPSLADGRDYLHDIIQRNWNPAILLKDVINLFPKFLKRVDELPRPQESQLLGEFHLGTVANVEDYFTLPNAAIFPGEEVLQDRNVSVERFYVLIESFFLSFEPADKTKNTIKLITWAHVQSIANIKKSKEDAKRLVVTWFDKTKQSGVVQNVYLVDEAKNFVEMLVQAGQNYGVKVSKGQKRDIPIEEVTLKSYQDMKIEELLDNISFLESQLEEQITIDVINLLMNLYQKAVEYFSAFNDPVYNDFMLRLHYLLQRSDVQAVLQSREDEEIKEKKRIQEEHEKKNRPEEEKKEEVPNPVKARQSPTRIKTPEKVESPKKSPEKEPSPKKSPEKVESPKKSPEKEKEPSPKKSPEKVESPKKSSEKEESPKKSPERAPVEETIGNKVDSPKEVIQEKTEPEKAPEEEKVDENVFAIDNDDEEPVDPAAIVETVETAETKEEKQAQEANVSPQEGETVEKKEDEDAEKKAE